MGVLLRGDGGGRVPGVCVVGVVCGVGGWGGDGRHMEVETGGAVCIEFGGVPVGEGGGRHPGYHGVHAEGYAENLAHGGGEGLPVPIKEKRKRKITRPVMTCDKEERAGGG